MTLLHRFKSDISVVEAPGRFNNPFYYSPHALCVMAAGEVRAMLSRDSVVAADAAKGKMFGVLVVRDSGGGLGYLAAFSGLLAGRNSVDGFVPPVFDMQNPDGYFKKEEAEISALNRKIKETECCDEYMEAASAVADTKRAMEQQLAAMREDMRKLDRLDEQTRFLAENSIETHEDIDRYRSDATDEISALKAERDDLRNKLKRVIRSGDETAVLEVKQQIAAVSNRIKKIKANFKTCDSVVERATRIREQLEELYNEQPERKENSDELFRRRGGTSRKDVPKRR